MPTASFLPKLRRHLLLGTLAFGVATACSDSLGPPSIWGDLRVSADRWLYEPRDRVIVRTENRTGRVLFCDHCRGEIQGFELRGEWGVSYGMVRTCGNRMIGGGPTEILVAIGPGERHRDTLRINAQAYTGRWRAVLRFEDEEGTEVDWATPSFRVKGTWKP